MHLKSAIKFQLAATKQGLGIFYSIIFLIYTTAIIIAKRYDVTVTSGTELSSMIFIFIVSIVSFKEFLQFSLQHGVARRDIVIGFICSMGILSLTMSVIDSTLSFILSSIMGYESMYNMAYTQSSIFQGIVWQAFLYWAVTSVGSFINLMYYRLSKIGRILVSVAVPISFVALITVGNDMSINGQPLFSIINRILSTPFSLMLVSLLVVTLFSLCNFLLARRATLN
jgi:hypothetical protein